MTYKLKFLPAAQAEWNTLNPSIQALFKKKLAQRLINPLVPKAQLKGGLKNCYKIKLLKAGYRLVYKVDTQAIVVLVIAVGKRDKALAYAKAEKRLVKIH